jgi:uncharacterized peroxidase-related enzyme
MSHAFDFGQESQKTDVARQLLFDYRQADLSPADRALCDYAVKLTLAPAAMTAEDVQTLRGHGLTDEQLTVAAQVIGFFNYITRIAQGLGVDHETWMDIPPDQWLREKGRGYLGDLMPPGRADCGLVSS